MPGAAEHLAQYNVTVEVARDFIFSNLDNLPFILQVADLFGVTNEMLAEIVGSGVTGDDVRMYFQFHGLDSAVLDPPQEPPEFPHASVGPIFPPELYPLAGLFGFNIHEGLLSNFVLEEAVVSVTGLEAYMHAFDPRFYTGWEDGEFSPAESGLNILPFPATVEAVASLWYGTLINLARTFDFGEVLDLYAFATENEQALIAGDPGARAALMALVLEIAADPGHPIEGLTDDASLHEQLVLAAIELVGEVNMTHVPTFFSGLLFDVI